MAKRKKDTLSKQQMAASDFGYPLAVLKSDPELFALFRKAVRKNYDGATFVAELRSTKWFRRHSDATRNFIARRETDPATFRRDLNQARASVRDVAVRLGAQLSDKQLTQISENVLQFGWNDAQIRDTLAGAVAPGANGTFGGEAATNVGDLRRVAFNNGVRLGDGTLRQWAVRMAAGEDESGFEQYVRNMAAQAFPTLAEQINAGMDVRDVAEPYIQQMAQTLEINPNDIDLFDPTLRKAMQATTQDGKVSTMPLWQFEQQLKKDDRYQYTDQAKDSAAKLANSILQSFGVI